MAANRKKCIINGKVILRDKICRANVFVEDDKIVEISSRSPEKEDVIDADGLYVSPGFIDLHTHGRAGSDTMYASFDHLNNFSKAAMKCGITSFLPTTDTMPIEDIRRAVENIAENKDQVEGAQILGVHLEGPFININYKGAQPGKYVVSPTIENYLAIADKYEKLVRKVTLAPELENAMELISYLTERQVVVSIGHTDATYEKALESFNLGATSGTHIYNAIAPMAHRAPGVVGAIMDDDRVYAELILDGNLVSYPAARILLRVKGKDKVILITDSLTAAGMGDGFYELANQKFEVRDGIARLPDGTLVGSVIGMNDMVRNACQHLGLSLNEAVNLASLNPAISINEHLTGEICVGKYADIILFDANIQVKAVIIKGRIMM